jgi:lysophospholipid acyltransferase
MLAVYLCCPLGLAMRLLPSAALRHLFSMLVGVLMVQWTFASTWIHPFAVSLFTYVVCWAGPKKHNHKIVMGFLLGYLFCCHAYYQYVYYLTTFFAFTGTQMVLTMKLTAFAYNLHDGRTFAKAKADGKPLSRSDEVMSKLAITEFPSLLEFFGYAFCFTAVLAGPSFEYQVSPNCALFY